MKKSLLKIIIFTLLITVITATLSACGFLNNINNNNGTGNGDSINGDGSQNSVEKKPALSAVLDNYSNLEEKGSVASTLFKMSFYSDVSGSNETYSLGIKTDLTRKIDDEEIYLGVELEPYQVDDKTVGVFSAIKTTLGLLIETGNDLPQSENARKALTEFIGYIEYINAFLLGKIDLSAELGIQNDDYNLLLNYCYNKDEQKEEKSSWFGVEKEKIRDLLDISQEANLLKTAYVSGAIFEGLSKNTDIHEKDSASKNTDAKGESKYSISLIKSKVFEMITKYVGNFLFGEEATKDNYDSIYESVSQWITVNEANLLGTSNSDDLPVEISSIFTINVNAPTKDIKKLVTDVFNKGYINEDTTQLINFLTGLLSTYVCGTNGEKNTIGITFEVDIKETYGYKNADYDTDDVNEKLFVPLQEKEKDRINVADVLADMIEDLSKYVEVVLEPMSENKYYQDVLQQIDSLLQEMPKPYKKSVVNEKLVTYFNEFLLEVQDDEETTGIINQILNAIQ